MVTEGLRTRLRAADRALALGIRVGVLAVVAVLVLWSLPRAFAQSVDPPIGSTVRVANTDGAGLNLRTGPGTSQAVVTRVDEGSTLQVTGASRQVEGVRWLEVKAAGGEKGWVSSEYVAVVSTPTPRPTATPKPQPSEETASTDSSIVSVPTPEPAATPGPPVELEVKIKYPETSGRDQEVTVYATRHGQPVPGVVVMMTTDDGEDRDEPLVRELDPTNEEGRTRRSFTIRDESGTVTLHFEAVAPDGGKGRAEATYFRR
ncbi:MAG: SH3 domain-containing protein [Chloroflexi bacterium]|nr:SH3 domain-containing protein [Chloroflexota bacterium]